MHTLLILNQHEHSGPPTHPIERSNARGSRVQLAALALCRLQLAEASNGFVFRLDLNEMRRPEILRITATLCPAALGRISTPLEPEDELRALLSRYGFEMHARAHIDGTTVAVSMITWNVRPLFQLPERPAMPLLLLPS